MFVVIGLPFGVFPQQFSIEPLGIRAWFIAWAVKYFIASVAVALSCGYCFGLNRFKRVFAIMTKL
jgi:hypothetical protein